MNHQQAYDLLQTLECEVDVNATWIDGVQVWPLVRQQLWSHFLRSDISSQSTRERPAEPRSHAKPAGKTTEFRMRPASGARFNLAEVQSQLGRADILFLSRRADHTEIFLEGAVDRIIDPLIWLAREQGFRCFKVSPLEGNASAIEQVERSVMLPVDDVGVGEGAGGINVLNRLQRAASVSQADELVRAIESIAGPCPVNKSVILSLVARLTHRSDYYDAVLGAVQPKLVMLGVYYSAHAAAMIHACRRRRIPVVDIQHGKQGLHHAMYGGWSSLPVEGYSVLPDVFWTWGAESAATIDGSMPAERQRPLTAVGGNRWLTVWRKGSPLRCSPDVEALFSRMDGSRRRILVSLQPIDDPIPAHLLSTMRNSPADWLWVVRTHPHQRAQASEVARRLSDAGVASFDVLAASSAPLYPLLARVDVHITCWSSVAYEALLFGKPSILVDPTALKLYSRAVEDGSFHYAGNEDSLMQLLTRLPEVNSAPGIAPYIETGDEVAIGALRQCLDFSIRQLTPGVMDRARAHMRRFSQLVAGWPGGGSI